MRKLHSSTPDWFSRIVFVLVETSHPGNVGAAARAMATMGLKRLILAAPKDPNVLSDPIAIARASGGASILHQAKCFGDFRSAVAPFTLAVAVSAETRRLGALALTPEEIIPKIEQELFSDDQAQVAFVFGCERSGLSVEQLLSCQYVCSIPGDAHYCSLNLSQAVQIIAYCVRTQLRKLLPEEEEYPLIRYSSQLDIDSLINKTEAVLKYLSFPDKGFPKKLSVRVRRLLNRTRLEHGEFSFLYGIFRKIELLLSSCSKDNLFPPKGS